MPGLSALLGLFGLIPGLGLKSYLAIAGVIILGLIGAIGYTAGSGGKREAIDAAIAENDLHWTNHLQAERDRNANELTAARRAGAAESDTPADAAERLRICESSATCRDRNRIKGRGVRDVPAAALVR